MTGAASGIGKELTNRLIKKGIRVLISDINEKDGLEFEKQLNSAHGEKVASFLKTDVMDSAQLKAVFDKATEVFGRIFFIRFHSQKFFFFFFFFFFNIALTKTELYPRLLSIMQVFLMLTTSRTQITLKSLTGKKCWGLI